MPRAKSPTPDPIGAKIRELRELPEYSEDDDDTTVTGDHNIVAMPGSHVHVSSDPEIQGQPRSRKKLVAAIVSTIAALGAAMRAILSYLHH